MTPYEIQILLHLHYSPDPPKDSPILKDTLEKFQENNLVKLVDGDYKISERGAAHVQQLCTLPWPTALWVDKNGDAINVFMQGDV